MLTESLVSLLAEDMPRAIQNMAYATHKKLTDAERRLVSDYALDGHHDINKYLRGLPVMAPKVGDDISKEGYKNRLGGAAKVIRDAIGKHVIPMPIVVWRGTELVEVGGLAGFRALKGKRVTTKAFFSTSMSWQEAAVFLPYSNNGVMWKISVAARFRAMPITDELTTTDNEEELLFAPGAQFKIDRTDMVTDRYSSSAWKYSIWATCIKDGF